MAGLRTSGPRPINPAGFSGLAALIAEGGENAARRKERFGETIGSALSGLGAMYAKKKERREDQAYRAGRDKVADSHWTKEFDALQADRKADNTRQDARLGLDAYDTLTDNALAREKFELERLTSKEAAGKAPSLTALASELRQQAQAKYAAGDQAGGDTDMLNAQRALMRAQQHAGLGGAQQTSSMMERPEAPRGLGRGSRDLAVGASLAPQIPQRGGDFVESDAAKLAEMLKADRARTDAILNEMPDKTPAQRAERERWRRVRDRAAGIVQNRIALVAEAERGEKVQKAAVQEDAFGQYLSGRGFSPQEVETGKAGRRGGIPEGQVATQLASDREDRAKDKADSVNPEKAAEAIADIMDAIGNDEWAIDAEGDSRADGANEAAQGHGRRLAAIKKRPLAAAQAFVRFNENPEAQDMILDAFGNDADAIMRAWRQANPSAGPNDGDAVAEAILRAQARRAGK